MEPLYFKPHLLLSTRTSLLYCLRYDFKPSACPPSCDRCPKRQRVLKSSPIEANSPLTNACLLCLDTAQHTTQWQPVMEREQDFRTGQQETSCFQETFATCDSLTSVTPSVLLIQANESSHLF